MVQILVLFLLLSGCSAGTTSSSGSGRLFSLRYDRSLHRSSIALIIPGLGQYDSSPGYGSVGAFYRERGVTPVFVNMRWKAAGIRRLGLAARQLDTVLRDSFPQARVHLFGFSFGAVVALDVAREVPASHILLCSMSPLYREDRARQYFPFRQLAALVIGRNGLSYASVQDRCVTFLYADHDNFIINKAIIRHRSTSFPCSETITVKNARHDISGASYQEAIRAVVQNIGR